MKHFFTIKQALKTCLILVAIVGLVYFLYSTLVQEGFSKKGKKPIQAKGKAVSKPKGKAAAKAAAKAATKAVADKAAADKAAADKLAGPGASSGGGGGGGAVIPPPVVVVNKPTKPTLPSGTRPILKTSNVPAPKTVLNLPKPEPYPYPAPPTYLTPLPIYDFGAYYSTDPTGYGTRWFSPNNYDAIARNRQFVWAINEPLEKSYTAAYQNAANINATNNAAYTTDQQNIKDNKARDEVISTNKKTFDETNAPWLQYDADVTTYTLSGGT